MDELEKFLDKVYAQFLELKDNDENKKCLSCDCYFGLLFYMREELTKMEGPKYEEMLKDTSSAFDKKSEVKMHKCLRCDPCPPAEWTSELLRKLRV